MVTPRITNKLRGSLGEIYYKEYCDQKGWAYTSLENIHYSMNPEWIFIFKKGGVLNLGREDKTLYLAWDDSDTV